MDRITSVVMLCNLIGVDKHCNGTTSHNSIMCTTTAYNVTTTAPNRTVKLMYFFQSVSKSRLVYWATLRLAVILPRCPGHIVISILIFCLKLFERIKMMISMMPLVAVVVFIYAVKPLCIEWSCAIAVFIDTPPTALLKQYELWSLRCTLWLQWIKNWLHGMMDETIH